MNNSGDKFRSLIIPNCHLTTSQYEKLQSCPFSREPKPSPDNIQVQSSLSSPEQPTGIEMVSLPDSFDEYQTPPEQSYSQNSSNDGNNAVVTKVTGFDEERVVDLGDELDDLDTEPMDVDEGGDGSDVVKLMSEGFETEVISSVSSPDESARQMFDKMSEREKETSDVKKCKLPALLRTQKENVENGNNLKCGDFKDVLSRVLKMVESEDGEGDGGGDFMETAKMRGLTFPRPRWWPKEGFKETMD